MGLVWNAPPSCPDVATVEAQIRQLETPGRRPAITSAEATVDVGADGRWHLRLETASGATRGSRTIDASSCAELAESAALILSVPDPENASPTSSLASAPSPFAPVALADHAAQPPPRAVPGPYAAVTVITEVHGFAGASAVSELGLVFGWAGAHVRGEAWVAGSVVAWNAEGSFHLAAVGVRGCPFFFAIPAVALGVCLGMDGGLAGTGHAFASSGNGVLARGLAGPFVAWSASRRVALSLHGDAALAFASPETASSGATSSPSGRVSGLVTASMELHF